MIAARLLALALAQAAANPVVFLSYLILVGQRRGLGIVATGETNVYRMIPGYYLAFAAVVCAGWLCLVVSLRLLEFRIQRMAAPDAGALLLYCFSAPQPSAFGWLRWVAYAGTALVAWVWVTGMEGNIMGFFGFPILLFSILFYAVATARSCPMWHFAAFFSPARLVYARGLYIQFGYFALAANPFFWYLLMEAGAKARVRTPVHYTALVITMSLLYVAWLSAIWGALKLTGAAAPWQKILTIYFAQTRTASGVVALVLILIALTALTKRLANPGAPALGFWSGALLATLMALQLCVAVRAFMGARRALKTDSAAAAAKP